ncbi:hydrogenase accessory protein [Methylosinus sp. Sm6]|uniref:hydrogenase accessory protein n=1 Tax=Methylosinus sp. Sm6 TaxID=2866948 RepID=UPI001C9A15B0|nr:hydrogenase accessory protein [Methylosinus sp. Sm6]MBY6241969.1 hydrogenase accessory protein [Methylosinus sp. Sm6]
MPSPLLRALRVKHGVAEVDEASIDAFLAQAPHALLFFAGDPAQRSETHDVAVILPQLIAAFAGRLRAAIVAPAAEHALARRFLVGVYPSLVVTRGPDPVGVLPKVWDWADYCARINGWLRPDAPVLERPIGPRVSITFSGEETTA